MVESHDKELGEARRRRLLRRYARDRDPADLERLVIEYRPLARGLARRYRAASAGHDDLEQVAYEGLIKAIVRFDPERGCAFTSFAVPTVLGELRRYLRDTAWPAHVPRAIQDRLRALREATARYAAAHRRSPTARELANMLGYEVEDVLEALEAGGSLTVAPLDDEADGHPAGDRIGREDPGFERVELLASIEQALPALSAGERQALRLHFGEALTRGEMARRLGTTRAKAARELNSAITTLRELQAA
jgi:RNA polymerase sigma-B factor